MPFDTLATRVRAALLVLLLVNLAYFAWSHWLAPKDPSLPVSAAVSAPPLQLANELLPVAADGSCVTVGPFATRDLAARARQTLTDAGYASVPREEQTRALDGYWVYLETPSTLAAERRLMERLSRGGIADAQVVGEGSARRISLGVFSDESRAIAQSERVAKLQLLPQIQAREKASSAIWLDLTLRSGATSLEGQKFQAGDSQLEFRPCPGGSGPPDRGNASAE